MDYPRNSSGYPITQNALNDFEPDQILLGCALTSPYHDSNHGEIAGETGDMGDIEHSPRDPLFWRFHKFVDNISVQRFFPPPLDIALTDIAPDIVLDKSPPQIISQNPFRQPGKITSLPIISENEKGLFGATGIPAISAQFNEPVTGVKPSDFTVNGSPATQVRGTGSGPYVFIGFKSPEIGLSGGTVPVNVTLSLGNITDIAGNHFLGSSWNYTLISPNFDQDRDGLKDGLEIELWLTDPTVSDSDDDTMSDGIEATFSCLNPIVNDKQEDLHMVSVADILTSMNMSNTTHLDFDKDNNTNIEEIQNKMDPCSADSNNRTNSLGDFSLSENSENISDNGNNSQTPFTFMMKKTGGIAGTTSKLQYDSVTKTATSIINGTASAKQVSSTDEMQLKRVLNNSGFFESENFYPPSNGTDYFEYTLIAALNNNLNAVYWTDASKGVAHEVENLPFIISHILNRTGF